MSYKSSVGELIELLANQFGGINRMVFSIIKQFIPLDVRYFPQ